MGATSAAAHEIVIHGPSRAGAGQVIDFEVHSTHVYGQAEEIEAVENVEAMLVQGETVRPVQLRANEKELRLDGSVALENDGPAVIVAHRRGLVWSRTTEGFKPGGRDQHPDALASNKYEKFTKLVVNANQDHTQPLGHRLEIVPIDDLSTVKVGDTIKVRVLYDGAPLATKVMATYLGFTDIADSYAWLTDGRDEGVAAVKITSPGIWLVRAQHEAEVGDGVVDRHILRAILQFEVS
jgi:uncharacterized GH25 family protein